VRVKNSKLLHTCVTLSQSSLPRHLKPKARSLGCCWVVSGNSSGPAHEMYTQHGPGCYTNMLREQQLITIYLHREFGVSETEGARGSYWQWYSLRPVRLDVNMPSK
jgi:hypothetical protein